MTVTILLATAYTSLHSLKCVLNEIISQLHLKTSSIGMLGGKALVHVVAASTGPHFQSFLLGSVDVDNFQVHRAQVNSPISIFNPTLSAPGHGWQCSNYGYITY